MKAIISLAAVSALAVACAAQADERVPYTLSPGPHAGNYEATLTGSGQSTDDFDHSSFGVTGSIGYYYTEHWLFTLKQGVQAADRGKATLVSSRTIVQAAYQFDYGKWQPYVGINAGGVFGAGVHDQGLVGPEVGLKYYVNESTFLFGNIAYEVPVDECCNGGNVPYSVGVGFNF